MTMAGSGPLPYTPLMHEKLTLRELHRLEGGQPTLQSIDGPCPPGRDAPQLIEVAHPSSRASVA